MEKINDTHKTQLSAACLLLSIAEADEILEVQELDTIRDILEDFFSISYINSKGLVREAQEKIKESTGLFEFGQHLNTVFDHSDRIDFISCIFEVAYADNDLHYLEHHTIKKIANILHVDRDEILNSKIDIKYL